MNDQHQQHTSLRYYQDENNHMLISGLFYYRHGVMFSFFLVFFFTINTSDMHPLWQLWRRKLRGHMVICKYNQETKS